MITLSESAKKSLEDYLRQARAYLRGSKSLDANEVEQNIAEHIENELEGAAEPVSCDVLDAVLKKLGSPQQWIPEEELPWWRKIILRLRSGPEDWRLAYLSFGLLILGFLILPSFIIAGLGLWWIILGCLLLKWWSLLQLLFKPFAGWFSRKWALVLFLIGLGLI